MGLLKKNPDVEDITPSTPDVEEGSITTNASATERLTLAVELVSRKFNLVDDNYRVVKFNDKGKVVDITLDGTDFIVSVTIKDSEMHGMYIPPKQAD